MSEDKNAALAGAAGSAAGAAASIGTIAAAGTVTGLGATGITSGLAAQPSQGDCSMPWSMRNVDA